MINCVEYFISNGIQTENAETVYTAYVDFRLYSLEFRV